MPNALRLTDLGLLACWACGPAVTEPVTASIEIQPGTATIVQGDSVNVTAIITWDGDLTGQAGLTIAGVPSGITATITSLQTAGRVTTATVSIGATRGTVPGAYELTVRGSAPGATAAVVLFTLKVVAACPLAGICEQWAVTATASSEWHLQAWGAVQATGPADVIGCTDDARAWASHANTGHAWLELGYAMSVHPTRIRVYEAFGTSSIVRIEVREDAGQYRTVYTAEPGLQTCPRVLTVPIAAGLRPAKVVRITLDQSLLQEWNEIDAVQLIGNP